MIRISQIRIKIKKTDNYQNLPMEKLRRKAAETLHIRPEDITDLRVRRRSIDARHKPEIYDTYTLQVTVSSGESRILKKNQKNRNVVSDPDTRYTVPPLKKIPNTRCVVVGSGPAGMFCAYELALAGLKPLVIERGDTADVRTNAVHKFWKTGVLDPDSNVQFGEGGAGTFSDGKLNTMVKDKLGRNRFVLDTFVNCGAPEDILWDAKPHLGTDVLVNVMMTLRQKIIDLGGEFRFRTTFTGVHTANGQIQSIDLVSSNGDKYEISCDKLILALGHSARDTFELLYKHHIAMEAKPFAVGFRIEHPQSMIDQDMYGDNWDNLPPSPYKLAHTFEDGRGVYSFCMCPGGYVVNASSEEGLLAVNGMSYADRASGNANSAIVITAGGEEFDLKDPLSGLAFQRNLERKAYRLGAGRIPQQLYGDFQKNQVSKQYGDVMTRNCGEACLTNLRGLLPDTMENAFLKAMQIFGKKINGFDRPDAVLSGIESRTSSPIRLPRDKTFQGSVAGLYPCGEGAGYAGGIMSAAMDGLKVAEAVIRSLDNAQSF